MSVTPIHVFAKWKVRPGQLENVLLILKELKAKSIQGKGNLFYEVHQDWNSKTMAVDSTFAPKTVREEALDDLSLGAFGYCNRRCGRAARRFKTLLGNIFINERSEDTVEPVVLT